MDPLAKVRQAHTENTIPKKEYSLILKRFPLAVEGINRIEKASGLQFPVAYVEPAVILSQGPTDPSNLGILYARTIPVVSSSNEGSSIEIVIQITAPLVAFGLKGTIHAILAHEFLHYLELMNRMAEMQFLSDEPSASLFESTYADSTRLLNERAVFDDKTLISHITKRFPAGFRDYKLEDKVEKYWIKKNLPALTIPLDKNITKVPFEIAANTSIDPKVIEKLDSIKKKMKRTRKKKYY